MASVSVRVGDFECASDMGEWLPSSRLSVTARKIQAVKSLALRVARHAQTVAEIIAAVVRRNSISI